METPGDEMAGLDSSHVPTAHLDSQVDSHIYAQPQGAPQIQQQDPERGASSAAQLGCSKCRYSKGGCSRCRNPNFRPRKGFVPREELAAVGRQQRRAARCTSGDPPSDSRPAKRSRGALPSHAPVLTLASFPISDDGGRDSIVGQLRHHLSQVPPASGPTEGLAEKLEGLHTWTGVNSAAHSVPTPYPAGPDVFAEDATPAAAVLAGTPTQSTAHEPASQATSAAHQHRTDSGKQQPQAGFPVAEAAGVGAASVDAKPLSGMKRPAGLEGDDNRIPPRSRQRPAKQRRTAGGKPVPAPSQRSKRPRSLTGDEVLTLGEPPRRYRKTLPPEEQVQRAQQDPQQEAQQQYAAPGVASEPYSSTSDSTQPMDIDMADYGDTVTATSDGSADPLLLVGGGVSASPGAHKAADAQETFASPGSKRSFMSLLEANMEKRRRERRMSGAGFPALQQLLHQPRTAKRQKKDEQQAGPAASSGAAFVSEPDPRLHLWEPPVSPFGLLEEELYDDPWKLLVACMLLNKTTGQQVRKVIWDLFTLCPTPAAAVAADTAAIEALIQPLGLFRKRAVAIQKLSRDFLEKQWKDPQELYGIGKYAADAYYIFCRNRWQQVNPDDKDLLKYQQWLKDTGGLGSGLTRHRTVPITP